MRTPVKFSKTMLARAVALALIPAALTIGCASNDKISKVDQPEAVALEQTSKWESEAASEDVKVTDDAIASEESILADSEIALVSETSIDQDTAVEMAALEDEGQNEELTQVSIDLEPSPEKVAFLFDSESYEVKPDDMDVLRMHAEYLKANPSMELVINGYADARGSAEYNFKLSKKRAEQVRAILLTLGAPELQIKLNSYGEGFPVSEKKWEENRRVELKYGQRDESIMASF